MGFFSDIGSALTSPFSGGGGGTEVQQATSNTTNTTLEIDTKPIAEALSESGKNFNDTIKIVADKTNAVNQNISNTLSQLLRERNIDNQQEQQLLQGIVFIGGAGVVYFATKFNKRKGNK